MTNLFKRAFDNWPCLDGHEYIEADLDGGVTVRAYIEIDPDASPDEECPEDVEAFDNDTLRYCTITLNVYVNGECIQRGARSLHQIGIEDGGSGTGGYLTECANDLLSEIDLESLVGEFAKKATAAARAVRRRRKDD